MKTFHSFSLIEPATKNRFTKEPPGTSQAQTAFARLATEFERCNVATRAFAHNGVARQNSLRFVRHFKADETTAFWLELCPSDFDRLRALLSRRSSCVPSLSEDFGKPWFELTCGPQKSLRSQWLDIPRCFDWPNDRVVVVAQK
jgi:hypothetical protein